MTKFVILRHGFSIYNKLHKFTGQSDIPLDEIGVKQAELAGKYITENYNIESICSSDLKRAFDTAKPVADKLGLSIETRQDLRELDVGQWQDIDISYVKEHFVEDYNNYKNTPHISKCGIDGENYAELTDRAVKAFAEMAAKNDGKTVLVTTHGGLIKALSCVWQDYDIEKIATFKIVNNASITEVDYDNGKAVFIKMGFDDYLDNKTEEF